MDRIEELNISIDEWEAEVEQCRSGFHVHNKWIPTEEQKRFIIACRVGERKVPYKDMARLWEKYFGEKVNVDALCERVNKLRRRGEIDAEVSRPYRQKV